MKARTRFRGQWALIGGMAAVSACAILFSAYQIKQGTSPMSNAVTIDALKIVNAERSVASKMFQNKGGDSDAIISMTQFGKNVTAVIRQVANGRMVIVRQAVVDSQLPDITDEVLTDLGLPKGVPTVDAMKHIEMAPTTSYQLMGAQMNADAKNRGSKDYEAYLKQSRKEAANALP